MGTDSSSATVRHFQFRGTDDRSFENIGEMRNDFSTKNFEKSRRFLLSPTTSTFLPSPSPRILAQSENQN